MSKDEADRLIDAAMARVVADQSREVKRTADRYIERGGYQKGKRAAQVPDDLVTLMSFLVWHDPNEIMGGQKAGEAFLAACRLLNLEPVAMRKIMKGEN